MSQQKISAGADATGLNLLMLQYDIADGKSLPSNVYTVQEDWDLKFRTAYSDPGNFIKSEAYVVRPEPIRPNFSIMDKDSLDYEFAVDGYKKDVERHKRAVALDEDQRKKIFTAMLTAISGNAKDQLKKEAEWSNLELAGANPLRLWQLIAKRCTIERTVRDADGSKAKNKARGSFITELKMTTTESVSEFKLRFENSIKVLNMYKVNDYSEAELVDYFIGKLDRHRYGKLQTDIDGGRLDMPKTLVEVYALTSEEKVLKTFIKFGGTKEAERREQAHVADVKQSVKPAKMATAKPVKAARESKAQECDEECFGCMKKGHTEAECTDPDVIVRLAFRKAALNKKSKARKINSKNRKADEEACVAEEAESDSEQSYEESYWATADLGHDIYENAFAGQHMRAVRAEQAKKMGRLQGGIDTMCSKHVFGAKELLNNIVDCDEITYKGIAGIATVNQVGDHEVFGKVYYKRGFPNLLSFGQLRAEGSGITIDLVPEPGGFMVGSAAGSYHFKNNGSNLYTTDFSDEVYGELCATASLIETVEENEKLFTKKQVAAAQRVRALSAAMGSVSMVNLRAIARNRRVVGIDFTEEDVENAFRIYGEDLLAIRGKSSRRLRTSVPPPVREKIVDNNVTMNCDLAFFSKVAVLVSYAKPQCLLQCNLVKDRTTASVRDAINRQKAALTSEGFNVVEITSDTEGAMVALKEELEAQGVRVSIHGPNSDSAEVDVKIKQLKNVTRAITSGLPYLLPFSLLMYAIFYACSKINMLPNSSLAHGYSPFEVFTGRSIDARRDLGATKSTGPIAFGTSCEAYEATTNTIADATRPGIFLGAKHNSVGSSYFFMLDTETVVAREQWVPRPIDLGTINMMNHIAEKKPLLPKNIRLIYKGVEVMGGDECESEPENQPESSGRRVSDAGGDMPDAVELEREPWYEDQEEDRLGPDEEYNPDPNPTEQLLATDDPQSSAPEAIIDVQPSDGANAYHHPAEESDPVQKSRQIPEAPWFLKGTPIVADASGERPRRERKPVERFVPGAYMASGRVKHTFQELWAEATDGMEQTRPLAESARAAQRERDRSESAFILTVEKALKTMGSRAEASIKKEMSAMLRKKVFEPVDWDSLSGTQKKAVIPSSMFLKEKTLPVPVLKSRFVAGGHKQDKNVYATEETSSPTVSNAAVNMVAAIAARERRKTRTMDVGTAFLNAEIRREVLMHIQKSLSKILCELKPEWKKFLRKDGSLVVRLRQALYGCVESARLWYDHISKVLVGLGFVKNVREECVFNAVKGDHQMTVCLFVDDLFTTSVDSDDLEWLRLELVKVYTDVTYTDGDVHQYLGQTYDFSEPGEVKISMCDYISDAMEEYMVTGSRVTPATEDLFKVDDSPALTEERSAVFHSRVAKILYAALRSRPDVLVTVSFLSTRVSKCTEEDWGKLERLLMYLNGTKSLGITLRASNGLRVVAHIDASFAPHEDMRSQTGVFVTLGSGPISASSKKQGLNTTSSTESELVGMSDGTPQVIWTKEFMAGQGYGVQSALMYQDNTSTIALAARGKSRSARTRHIAIRYFFIKDRVESGEIVIEHLGTDQIIADGLTKPLQGDAFRVSRDRLMGTDRS